MPIYILKRYNSIPPSDDDVWHLELETAFHAVSDQKAVAIAQKQNVSDLTPHSALTILLDPQGRRLWECLFEQVAVSAHAREAIPVQLNKEEI